MKKVLCIGEALIDMICSDKGCPLKDGEHFLKKAGGAPANVAAAIASFGGKVSLLAKTGDDPFGHHISSVLSDFGVETGSLYKDPVHFTTMAFVSLMENGERDFYFNRGADGQLTVQDSERVNLREFAIVHFGSATAFLPGPLQDTYTGLLKRAREAGSIISFDPNYRELLYHNKKASFTQQARHFIAHCHFFKMSEEEALLITGSGSLDKAVARLASETGAVFAITLGQRGTMLSINGQAEIIPSIPVSPVDTTGAGDAFVGAVLYQLAGFDSLSDLSADQWRKLIGNGNRAGAKTCEYMGAMEAFRHLDRALFSNT